MKKSKLMDLLAAGLMLAALAKALSSIAALYPFPGMF